MHKNFLTMYTAIKRVREIAAKTAKQVTAEDKAFVRSHAEKYNVTLPKDKPNCKSCYVDAAVAIYRAIKNSRAPKVEQVVEKEQESGAQKKQLKLMDSVDVMWRGIRVNAASATPERLAEWVAQGFPTIFCE